VVAERIVITVFTILDMVNLAEVMGGILYTAHLPMAVMVLVVAEEVEDIPLTKIPKRKLNMQVQVAEVVWS
jgi:hypothetical protein